MGRKKKRSRPQPKRPNSTTSFEASDAESFAAGAAESAATGNAESEWPATEEFLARQSRLPRIGAPRPKRWFLAAALLLQAAWTFFLAAMAVWG